MRSVKISDLLDTMEAPEVGLKETAAISPDRIKEIAMKKIHTDTRQRTFQRKHPAALILAAALALALSVTAFAAYRSGFFRNAFGTGVAGREAFERIWTDQDGNVVKTEHYPAIERVEADEETAEKLIGAYVAEIGQRVTLENYTFTVENLLLDENGIGVLTLHVENPDGHGIKYSGRYEEAKGEHPPFNILLERESGDYAYMDTREYLAEAGFAETQADYVVYFTPFEPLPADEALRLTLRLMQPDVAPPDRPSVSIRIPAAEKVAAHSFSAKGVNVAVSPVGMTLSYDVGASAERIENAIVLRYSDGSEYTIQGNNLVNFSVASASRDKSTQWFAFNRLADPESITEIFISGHWTDAESHETPYEFLLK